MNLTPDQFLKNYRGLISSNTTMNGNAFEPMANTNSEAEAKRHAVLVEWLLSVLPSLNLPPKASEEDLRACFLDGIVLCQILNRLRPGLLNKGGYSGQLSLSRSENVKMFLAAIHDLGIPKFEMSDLEKGSMKPVIGCLLTLRTHFTPASDSSSTSSTITKSGSTHKDASSPTPLSPSSEGRHKVLSESKFQSALRSPLLSEPSASMAYHVGHKFHEVFQLKQGRYTDLPATKISEMMKSNSLDNAPTQSLLSVVNGILDESVERKNGEIPHRVACLLRKVVQEIERRISTQAEHLRTQNNLFKAREEKYQSRIRVLEALASGTGEETEVQQNNIASNQAQLIKTEKSNIEDRKKIEEEIMVKLMKEKEEDMVKLMKEKDEDMVKLIKEKDEDMVKLMKEKDQTNFEILSLKKELETAQKTYELRCLQMETEAKVVKASLEDKVKELERNLADWRNKVIELEANSASKCQSWNQKEQTFQRFMNFQFGALRELRLSSGSIKQEILKAKRNYSEEFNCLGMKLTAMADAAENYHAVLTENRKFFNEIQELKGNIRVYCRIRPFLPGQTGRKSIVDYIGDNGELRTANPSKPGKDGHRMFKFNKVYSPAASQAEVFSDIQPLVRSVLDGYNVCIFAYGQTGSGKTYTMSGPNEASGEDLGVNFRALDDLFNISQSRSGSIMYEIGVQVVEIYNEQVRDLLSNDCSQKRLGIMSRTQPNGLAVPDASMQTVTSTSDVMEIMDIGLKNRAMSSTALNERSSRSHSVVTIHVRGKDLKTGTALHGNLHLVDLAGSERVDRSEVTGDRLKEAQHINKSLSALGDVVFALAQKSPHVPYRNSKLTQLLQSALGGQAKTLMFVQLNPDINSYTESMSTLKFAERVSGVELGAAKSSKDSRDVRELMEQLASLKDTLAKKDEEIERLQLLKDLKNVYPNGNEKSGAGSFRTKPATRIMRPLQKTGLTVSTTGTRDLSMMSSSIRKTITGNSTLLKSSPRHSTRE